MVDAICVGRSADGSVAGWQGGGGARVGRYGRVIHVSLVGAARPSRDRRPDRVSALSSQLAARSENNPVQRRSTTLRTRCGKRTWPKTGMVAKAEGAPSKRRDVRVASSVASQEPLCQELLIQRITSEFSLLPCTKSAWSAGGWKASKATLISG